jgi:hypothetical protein
MRILVFVAVTLLSAALGARAASAHFGAEAWIFVPLDHINPGQMFEVVAADLTPNASVSLTMTRDATSVSLGEAVADAEGHFTTTLPLPTEFPSGYAQLVAVAADGTSASTWVLVGPRTSATPPPPGRAEWWADPSVLVLGAVLAGGVGALGYALLRRRQVARAPVAAGGAGRRSTGKAARRSAKR